MLSEIEQNIWTMAFTARRVHAWSEPVEIAAWVAYMAVTSFRNEPQDMNPKAKVSHEMWRWMQDLSNQNKNLVTCNMCGMDADAQLAHLHQGEYIGECCWDDRFRATE